MQRLKTFVLILCLPAAALATTRKVPQDYATIQAAINASVDGDTVLVAPGTYQEKIDFLGKDIAVASSGGAAVTTIHPAVAGSVVTFKNGETKFASLTGFTITGGTGTPVGGDDTFGGGIYCLNSSPQILRNVIQNNSARGNIFLPGGSGGGVYCNNASPSIGENTISGNQAQDNGGGIYCTNGATPFVNDNVISGNLLYEGNGGGIWTNASLTIKNNTISGNLAWASGGGIHCTGGSSITSNTITSNTCQMTGGGISCGAAAISKNTIGQNIALGFVPGSGGGIYCSGAAVVDANLINGNRSSYGGGIHCASGSPTITNNVVVSNRAEYGGSTAYGGGIYCTGASPVITNDTIARNTAQNDGGGIDASASTKITNCILWDDTAPAHAEIAGSPITTYSDVEGGFPGSNNFSLDPQFADAPNGDFHLLPGSPCINTGSNGAPSLPGLDFDGDARIHYGTVDVGADEFDGCYVTFSRFGQGLAGSGGYTPILYGTNGSCNQGGHVVHISAAVGAAKGNLWVGTSQTDLPFFGGHFYVGFGTPWVTIPIKLNGLPGVPGAGFLDIPGANVNAYAPLTLFMQVSLQDPGAVQGVSLTNACKVMIGE